MNDPLDVGRLMGAERATRSGVDREALIEDPARCGTERASACRVTSGAGERTVGFPLQPRSP